MSTHVKLPVTATVPLTGSWKKVSVELTRMGLAHDLVRDGRETRLWLRARANVCGLQASLTRRDKGSGFGPAAIGHRGDTVVFLGHLGAVVMTPEEYAALVAAA